MANVLLSLVFDSCGYGWYHSRLLASYRSPDRWGRQASTKNLQLIRVRGSFATLFGQFCANIEP